MFKNFVLWFASTDFYINYVSQWPAPLNNVSFDAFILLILIIYGAWQAYNGIQSMKFHQRLKKKQQELEEQRLNNELNGTDNASTDKLFNQYMKFILVAEMKKMTSMSELSFDEFKSMKNKAEEEKPDDRVERLVDDMTGTFNREAFREDVEKISQKDMAVVYFDANNLKKTNDELGHSYGDKLILKIAEEARNAFPDHVYRVGGDEFIALLDGAGKRTISRKIDFIRSSLTEATELDKDNIIYDCAIGYAVGDGSKSKQQIVEEAERAMYADKKRLKGLTVERKIEEKAEEPISEPVPADYGNDFDEESSGFAVTVHKEEPTSDAADDKPDVIAEKETDRDNEPEAVIASTEDAGAENDKEEPASEYSAISEIDFSDVENVPAYADASADDAPDTIQEPYIDEIWGKDEAEPERKSNFSYEDDDEIPVDVSSVIGSLFDDEDETPAYEALLREKQEETESDDDVDKENDFFAILNSIEYKSMQDASVKAMEEKRRREAADRMKSLDKEVSSQIRVEGIAESHDDPEARAAEDADFERRRTQALKQEEKEQKKRERQEQKEQKRREKMVNKRDGKQM